MLKIIFLYLKMPIEQDKLTELLNLLKKNSEMAKGLN
jgi:hypothetical protein